MIYEVGARAMGTTRPGASLCELRLFAAAYYARPVNRPKEAATSDGSKTNDEPENGGIYQALALLLLDREGRDATHAISP